MAKHLKYKRVPYSGALWPHKQDLVKTIVRGVNTGEGGIEKWPAKYIAQVKTTESETFTREYDALLHYADVERAKPQWYYVVRTPNEALIFRLELVKSVKLGIGGDE